MPTIAEVRQKYPQYQDLSDDALADALHKKFYSDMPVDDFKSRIGLSVESDVSRNLRSELSAMTQNPAKAQYDALPAWKKPLVAASDIADLTANGLTMGWGNKAAAAARSMGTGNSYEAELADMQRQTQGARRRAGGAGDVAEIAGGLKTALLTAGGGLTLAGVGGTGAMTGAKGLALRSLLMGGEGTAYAAATGAGNSKAGEELDAATDAAPWGFVGGVGGNVVGEGISAGLNKIGGMFNKRPAVPSGDDISRLKDAAYQRADDAGVMFGGDVTASLRDRVYADLAQAGYHPKLQPGVSALVEELDKLSTGNVTLKGLDTVRKMAGNAYIPGNESNNAFARQIVSRIDEAIDSAPAIMGDNAAGAGAIREARDYASRGFKLEKVQKAIDSADLRAASTGSGGNVDNATRQNLRRLLEGGRGWKPDEAAALEKAVRGTTGQNALRLAGKLSPSGNGLMAALGVGGAMVNPAVGALSLGGMGAKALADGLTTRNVSELADIIAAGGSKAATKAAPNALQRLSQSKRDALIRLIMGAGINQTVTP